MTSAGFDAERLRRWAIAPVRRRYTRRDTILYALGLGLGADPCDADQLRFVYEEGLAALPSFGTVLAYPFLWYAEPGTGVDLLNVVHAELGFENHAQLPVEGEVIGTTRVSTVEDKGEKVGALLATTCEIRDPASGTLLTSLHSASIARAHGGFEGGARPPRPPPEAWPERPPDRVFEMPTLPQAALIFRLSGDFNPLHAAPAHARRAGFERPLLHGRCTFGIAAWALMRTCCDADPARLTSMRARLASPVFPGDTIRTEVWIENERLRFRASVRERAVMVLSHGEARRA